MGDKVIKITIKQDATLEAEGMGFKGKECEAAMEFVKSLGKVKDEKKKPDYYDGGSPKINVQTTR